MKTLVKKLLIILLFLTCVQSVRALVHWGLWTAFDASADAAKQQIADILAYLSVGILLLLIFRPSKESLGIKWKSVPQKGKIIYLIISGLLIASVLSSWFLDPMILLENVKAVFVVPIFEELIFRGWVWGNLEKDLRGKFAGVVCWVITSALFALWHLGYTDIFYLRILPLNPGMLLGDFLINKVLFTFCFGLAVGVLRWYTKKTYGSLLLHGFLNLFGK